jgi:hypothetical protein
MSNTRDNSPVESKAVNSSTDLSSVKTLAGTQPQKQPQSSDFYNYYMKSIFTGLLVGPISSTLTFPIDKIAFVYQTWHGAGSPSLSTAAKQAFRHPLNGYFPGIFNSACKNLFMFPAKAFFTRQLETHNPKGSFNKEISGFLAGLLTVYVMSPISVIKALRYNNTPVSQIRQLDFKSLFRGVHATAYRDGVQFGIFFGMLPYVSNYIANPFIAGMTANLMGAVASNPISVISTNQKIHGKSMYQTALTLFQQEGIKSFYRGFFRTTALRMSVQGGATGFIISFADKLYDRAFNRHVVSNDTPKIEEPISPSISRTHK